MPVRDLGIRIESKDLERLGRILKQEADGKALRRELAANLRKASEPARDAARSAITSMQSAGLPHDGESIRTAIAKRIVTEARLSGRSTGARVVAKRKSMPRGFEFAARRFNRESFRHRVFGREIWVTQVGKPKWFDDALKASRSKWHTAVVEAMNHTAERIARKVH